MSNYKQGYDYDVPTGIFLKLPVGTTRLRILDQPIRYETSFEGSEPRLRFAVPVCVMPSSPSNEPTFHIFEFGPMIYADLKALNDSEDWGDPVGYTITIDRKGSGKDTEYKVIPGKASPLPAKMVSGFTEAISDWKELATKRSSESPTGGSKGVASQSAMDEYDPFAEE